MKLTLFASVAILSGVTLAASCNADNCARAITGTAKGPAATRISDCNAYVAFSALPSYATACSNVARYSSACSCAGVSATTNSPIATPTGLPEGTPFAVVVAYQGKKIAATVQKDADRADNYIFNEFGPSDSPYDPYTVLAANPGNVASFFTIFRRQLMTADKSQAATLNQFYFDDNGEEGQAQTYFYFVPAARNDIGQYDADPILCDVGTYDGTVPGYPLNCHSIAGSFHIEAIVTSNGQPVLSTIPPRADLGQVAAQLYAVPL